MIGYYFLIFVLKMASHSIHTGGMDDNRFSSSDTTPIARPPTDAAAVPTLLRATRGGASLRSVPVAPFAPVSLLYLNAPQDSEFFTFLLEAHRLVAGTPGILDAIDADLDLYG